MLADGFYSFGEALDTNGADALLASVRAARAFGPNLFLSEAEFDANPVHKGTNPRPGRNLAEHFPTGFDFIERDPAIVSALAWHRLPPLLGPHALFRHNHEVWAPLPILPLPSSSLHFQLLLFLPLTQLARRMVERVGSGELPVLTRRWSD